MAATDTNTALSNLAASIVGGQAPSVGSVAGSIIQAVTIESQFTPPIGPFSPFAAAGLSGLGDATGTSAAPTSGLAAMILGYLRPSVTVDTIGGEIVLAPWGQPNGNWLPNAVGLLAGVAALTAWMLDQERAAKNLAIFAAAGFGLGYVTRPQP
jgi:hypothetical protein